MTYKTSSDRTAVVSTEAHYMPMNTCPIAKKVIPLGAGGVATVAQYDGKNIFWVGWHPLPKRPIDTAPLGGGLEH